MRDCASSFWMSLFLTLSSPSRTAIRASSTKAAVWRRSSTARTAPAATRSPSSQRNSVTTPAARGKSLISRSDSTTVVVESVRTISRASTAAVRTRVASRFLGPFSFASEVLVSTEQPATTRSRPANQPAAGARARRSG